MKTKISLFTNVPDRGRHHGQGRGQHLRGAAHLRPRGPGHDHPQAARARVPGRRISAQWKSLVNRIRHPKGEVDIALVGKYAGLKDSYLSLKQALDHGGLANRLKVNISWIEAEDLEKGKIEKILRDKDGVLVPGGFGHRGIEGKIRAVDVRPREQGARSSASAWACSARRSSSPATSPA